MTILFNIIFYFIGVFVGSFFLLQLLIVLFFGIPITIKFQKIGIIKKKSGIIPRYFISFIILSALLFLAVYIVNIYFHKYDTAFYFGIVFVILSGFNKIGKNASNMSDYINTNNKYIDFEKLNK